METSLCRPVPVSRAVWLRLGDGVFDATAWPRSVLRALWVRWQAERRQAAEFRALRELSASVLRDIGVDPETMHRVRHRRQQDELVRDSFLRAP
ncbi:MAG: hypothetical protein IT503_09050 [Burkholderiaceae bacterium]|nr:MAG: DUF1127 domain-containing protein [Burkholderiaceae bacterium]MBE7426957.1 hypothetical protein [Ideonella sp.]MCC7286316.1 hypothetical protein [Burkholderiaceae bacterium]